MSLSIRRVEYFRATVRDEPGQGFGVLTLLARQGVNLLAFEGVPLGAHQTQLTMYPEDSAAFQQAARRAGMAIDGPHRALLVQGDDELGALAKIHRQLADAGISVVASAGVADGRGGYGYLIHLRPADIDRAARALQGL